MWAGRDVTCGSCCFFRCRDSEISETDGHKVALRSRSAEQDPTGAASSTRIVSEDSANGAHLAIGREDAEDSDVHIWDSHACRSMASAQRESVEFCDFGLDPFSFGFEDQWVLYLQIMQSTGLQDAFSISSGTICSYAQQVIRRYRDVPYHNSSHAVSVAQFLFMVCTKCKAICESLRLPHLLAMFVAVLVHDADHPGNNNVWEVATKSPLAVKYQDIAVLEQHHAAIGLQILSEDASDMFEGLANGDRGEVKKTYMHAILQTDMAQHLGIVERTRARLNKAVPANADGSIIDCNDLEERRELVGLLVHSVDISNPLLPRFDLACKWAARITEEFINQYKKEVIHGLPPTKQWANLDQPLVYYKSQIGFIEFVVAPLWNLVIDMFPDLQTEGNLRDSLLNNKARWEYLRDEEEAKDKVDQTDAVASCKPDPAA